MTNKNGVILMMLHPHTNHKSQPLDHAAFGLFNTCYNTAMKELFINPKNVEKTDTIYHASEFVGKGSLQHSCQPTLLIDLK